MNIYIIYNYIIYNYKERKYILEYYNNISISIIYIYIYIIWNKYKRESKNKIIFNI